MKTLNTQSGGSLPSTTMIIWLILAMVVGMSNTIIGGTRAIPYDEGDSEEIPAAAARLCNIGCSRVAGGCAYTFDIEVFESCWTPVYALEIEALWDGAVEPVAWPEGWKAATVPLGPLGASSMVFYTVADPIPPGMVETGFGLVSYSGSVSLRWFPTDDGGILVGKVSRTDLSCPTATETQSWGSIKAIYR